MSLVVLNVLFVRALAEHLPASTPFTPTAVNPGFCLSDLRRDATLGVRIQMKMMDIILGRTAEQGSRNLLWAALGPDGKEGPHLRYMRGAYVSCAGLLEPGDNVMSKAGYELQQKLWVREFSARFIRSYAHIWDRMRPLMSSRRSPPRFGRSLTSICSRSTLTGPFTEE